MPLYEYECERCGKVFETLCSIKERDNVECPECHKPARRLLSGFAVGGGGGGSLGAGVPSGAACSLTSG